MTTTNTRLQMVYNNSGIITNAGFTMQSNYILPVLSRMVDEKIINISAQTVIQTILSYKHTEENPYPSRDELALRLGKSVSYVRKALKSINDAGILLVEKNGRRNTYNFQPLFNLIEKFIVEFVYNDKKDVSISDLLENEVNSEASENDFGWVGDYKGENKANEAKNPVEDESHGELPERLKMILESNNIGTKGIEAVESKYNVYKEALDIRIFMEKIAVSANKDNFVAFFNKCIDNAYINEEVPKETGYTSKGKKEVIPKWFKDKKDKSSEKGNTSYAEKIYQFTHDELLQEYDILIGYKEIYDNYGGNESVENQLCLVNAKLDNHNISIAELLELEASNI